jgi:hypothetical protein
LGIAAAGCTSLIGDFTASTSADGSTGPTDATTGSETGASEGGGDTGADTGGNTGADTGADSGEDAGMLDSGQEGSVTMCVAAGSCSPGACQTGVQTCEGGVQGCMKTGSVRDGTQCDASAVCSNGGCEYCPAGVDCNDAGPCNVAKWGCSSGAPVCTQMGNATNGTPCGAGMVCNGGSCQQCVGGSSCPPSSNPCNVGALSCTAGVQCNDTGKPQPPGTFCSKGNVNGVCDGNGNCVQCAANNHCTTPDGCQTGVTSCTTGAQTCVMLQPFQDSPPTKCANGAGICCGGTCSMCATLSGNEMAQCSNNACQVTCLPGYSTCPTSTATCGTQTGSDPLNCGACGHSCLNGTCANGQCQPILLGTTVKSTANERGIAVDANNLYVTETIGGASLGYVESCPLSGCTGGGSIPPAKVIYTDTSGSAYLGAIATDVAAPATGYIFFGDQNNSTAYAIKPDGTLVYTVNAGAPQGYVSDGTTFYIAAYGGIFTANKATGGSVKQMDTSIMYYYRDVAVDPAAAWAVSASGTSNNVMKCPLAGPLPEMCQKWDWTSQGSPYNILVLGMSNQPIIRTTGGGIWACKSNSDCSVANAVQLTTNSSPIAGDATYVYFGDNSYLYRCPAQAASCPSDVRGPSNGFPSGIAADASWLYWVTGGGLIYKVAK